jgi:3-oxoacyl-[acyl-carrier protein] reductase
MQKRFTGRTAVISGGASGIGLAIAWHFVHEGGKVITNDINSGRVAALAAELGEFGVAMVEEVTHEDDVVNAG